MVLHLHMGVHQSTEYNGLLYIHPEFFHLMEEVSPLDSKKTSLCVLYGIAVQSAHPSKKRDD